ncbi:MAG: BrnA antitoxin family protein [Alphaproteobacteria bacterium]|nr:BrnA antitoxin family protein [Alphaproteobacteria bacterium]
MSKSQRKPKAVAASSQGDDDIPEWTAADFKRARPAAKVVPEIVAEYRRGRGPQKTPTKKLVSLRLSQEVLDHFKATGPGWQTRIDKALKKVVGV